MSDLESLTAELMKEPCFAAEYGKFSEDRDLTKSLVSARRMAELTREKLTQKDKTTSLREPYINREVL